jgi:hypothetical protein
MPSFGTAVLETTVESYRKSGRASDKEVHELMLDKEAWRSRIKMIVAANKEQSRLY